jgi:hypothetical protein
MFNSNGMSGKVFIWEFEEHTGKKMAVSRFATPKARKVLDTESILVNSRD